MTCESKSEYGKGWHAAMAQVRRDVAAALKVAEAGGRPDAPGEKISRDMARYIFAMAFGTPAADDEFGADPDMEMLLPILASLPMPRQPVSAL